ncbi:MAG: hypothetical protein H7222_08815 [Methylotenera sp.]|nr:hypothetical protein [Oligoflexia bacterium]
MISQNLFVSFVSTQLHWDAGITVPIPGLKNSTVSVAPDLNSSGTVFQLSVGLKTLLDDISVHHELGGFPDGRALPDVATGMLPRWDTDIHGLKLSVYLSEDAFGLFVPLKLISPKGAVLDLMVSVAITDEKGNLLGKAYAIPASSLSSSQPTSGIFVLIPFIRGQLTDGTALSTL